MAMMTVSHPDQIKAWVVAQNRSGRHVIASDNLHGIVAPEGRAASAAQIPVQVRSVDGG